MKTSILFNPNSTGDSEANAKKLAEQLKDQGIKANLTKTTHAGHGEEIAERYAKKDEPIILISSSGDGGYHEVVNGALAHSTKKFIIGVLPSGNANDHHSALGSGSLANSIKRQKFKRIDTIKVSSTVKGRPWVRYAHSYVSTGVAANAAKRLTEDRPNQFTEKWIVLKSLFSFKYIKISEANKKHRYSSMVFSNIDKMSKVLKLSETSSVTDGKFEVSTIRFHSKLRLVAYLLTAATIGLKQSKSISSYEFDTIRPLPIQLDGDVYVLDANSKVVIESVRQNLRCVL